MKDKRTKQEEAKIRQEKYNILSIKEKINRLDIKFGKNKGAKKERAKLNKIKIEEDNSEKRENNTEKNK